MGHLKIKPLKIFTTLAIIVFLNSCYYDNVEYLYPVQNCDTTEVTFSADILPIINNQCTNCHSGANAGGNINLETYNDIVASVNDGGLMGSIRHDASWSPMPKNGAKMDDCKIQKLDIWINNGTPDN